jgi:RNA polymerase sigma-70 factor, ECF subfamily
MGSVVSAGDSPRAGLDAMLQVIVDAAHKVHPAFNVPTDVFVAYVRERLPVEIPPLVALRRMHTSDLYLACGCARGEPQALVAFDQCCLSYLDRVLGKMGIDSDVIVEIKHDVRFRVLVGERGRAQILDFSGRGDLRSWVSVIATRRTLQRQVRARREVSMDDDELMQRIVAPDDPELDHIKRTYCEEFKLAFESVLRALPDREQTLLRQHYVDGLTLDELASLYRVHRATAARLLARARATVLETTRERMMSRLEVSSGDLDSILRMIWSRIEISLRGLRRGRKR